MRSAISRMHRRIQQLHGRRHGGGLALGSRAAEREVHQRVPRAPWQDGAPACHTRNAAGVRHLRPESKRSRAAPN
eukprot:366099-Chlamydomonas_euryale.AAC.4